MYKHQKERLQICLDSDDVRYLIDFAHDHGANNASQAISKLIYDHQRMKDTIEKIKEAQKKQQQEQTYKEVRQEQMVNKEKWAFLREGKPDVSENKISIESTKQKKVKQKPDGSFEYVS